MENRNQSNPSFLSLQKNPHPTKYDKQLIIKEYQKGLSLPKLHVKYGISESYAYDILCKAKIMRTISTALTLHLSGHATGWRKLNKMRAKTQHTANTRTLSIPTPLLIALNLDPDKDLVGKWSVSKGKLVLEVREAKQV